MKRIPIALIATVVIVASIAINLDIWNQKRSQLFQKCIQNEPTDTVCDSCWQAIYHEESPF